MKTPSDLPPGVTGREREIDNYDPMDETTEAILDDCQNYGISDMDSFVVWKLGVAAWKKAKDLGARWPHE